MQKTAALIFVAVFASACTQGKMRAACSPTDAPSGSPHAATAPDHIDIKPDQDTNAADEGTSRKAIQSKVDVRGLAKDADASPPSAAAERERPSAHNTGPRDPGALVPSGNITVRQDGAVIEDVDVTGGIYIQADNVTLRNFRVTADAWYGVQVADGHSGIVIEDGEITNAATAGLMGVGFTARRLYLHDCGGDGMKVQGNGGPTLVEYCFVEKLGTHPDAHADGSQTNGGSNITFRYNNFDMPHEASPNWPGAPYKSNAAIIAGVGPISNLVIEYNWLNGGNYTVYCSKDDSRGVSVRYNKFGRDYKWGLIVGPCDEIKGNVWADTGDPI